MGIIPSVGTSPTEAHTKQQFLRGKPWASVGFRTRPHRRCKMSSPSSSTRGMPVTPIRPGRPGKLRRSVDSDQTQLEIVPVNWEEACSFVSDWHRHLRPPRGHKFSIGVMTPDGILRGVATVGRPVARAEDDGRTLEVTRTATDSTPNTNSALYGAAWRAAKALGYRRLVTRNQEGESGVSLRAAGYRVVAERPARPGWDAPSRPRSNETGNVARTLWEADRSHVRPAKEATDA